MRVELGSSVWSVALALAAVALMSLLAGCGDSEPEAETPDVDPPPRQQPVATIEPTWIEVVNTTEVAVVIRRYGESPPELQLAPHGIGRIELVPNKPVQLYVDRGNELRIPHAGIEFVPSGETRYVWDLGGRARFVHAGIRQGEPTRDVAAPHVLDRFAREGVVVFRTDYGLLDTAVEIEPRRGRAPRKIYRKLSASDGAIGELTVEELEAVLFQFPQAYLPDEQAVLVPLAVEAWPNDFHSRLLPLVETGSAAVTAAVAQVLVERPSPSLARQVRELLLEHGNERMLEARRRAYVRILAACGTRSDLEAVWEGTTYHVGRRHMVRALREETGAPVVEFFLQRLLSDDANLVHEAWEYLLDPQVLRDPAVLTTAKLHLETDWTLTQEFREEQYRRLLSAAFHALPRARHYPPQLVDWLMLETLHRLDVEQARIAIEHFADRKQTGIPVLQEAFKHLPATKRRDVIARPLIDHRERELYPELEALLLEAIHDPTWEDIARPAARRLVRDSRMLTPEYRERIFKELDKIERPWNRRRAIALFEESWRTMLVDYDLEALEMSDEERREQLKAFIFDGIDSSVARHAFESIWTLLVDERQERAALLNEFAERYDEVRPENRAVILYALIDHVRLARDHDREPWVDAARVRELILQGLTDDAPGVREIAFGSLVMDAQWYHEAQVRKILDETLMAEPLWGKHEAFTILMLTREAREAGRRVRQGDAISREFLATLLTSRYDPVVIAAIDGLAKANCDDAVDLLTLQYFSLRRSMRHRALLALAEARTVPVELFIEAARSESIEERRMAYRAMLDRLQRTSDDYLEELLLTLVSHEPDEDLRKAFAEWHETASAEPDRQTLPNW